MSGGKPRAMEVALWGVVAVATLLLAQQRLTGAVAAVGLDFGSFYWPAAEELVAGGNPYDVNGYVYSPLVALLVAPLTPLGLVEAHRVWSAVLVACLVATAASTAWWPGLSGWRRPVLVGFATVTILHFWPTTLMLYLGQADPLVAVGFAAAVALAAHGRARAAAALVGVCAVLKTWPVLLGLGLLGRPMRWSPLVVLALTAAAAPGLALVMGGPRWVAAMSAESADLVTQPLVSHSVLGFTDLMFTETGVAQPVYVSTTLGALVAVALVGLLVGSLAVLLRRGVDHHAGLAHAAGVVVLLLPTSHLGYLVLVLPWAWWWGCQILRSRSVRTVAGFAIALAWWLVCERSWPDNGSPPEWSALRYSVVFLATYPAILASCWLAVPAPSRHVHHPDRLSVG